MMPYTTVMLSPLGKIGIITQQDQLFSLRFLSDAIPLQSPVDSTSQTVVTALSNYFAHPSDAFCLPLSLLGTAFQKSVWQAIEAIPCGQTTTYGALAQQLQTSPRAIGQACRTNPIPIIIPCHRVTAAHHIGGYAGTQQGALMKTKKWLLHHEKRCCANVVH